MNQNTQHTPGQKAKYAVRIISGYYNPFFGTQKTVRTASKYWTLAEAEERAAKIGGEVVKA